VLVPFLKKIDERDQQLIRIFEGQRPEAIFRESPLVLFVNIWMVVFLGFFLFRPAAGRLQARRVPPVAAGAADSARPDS